MEFYKFVKDFDFDDDGDRSLSYQEAIRALSKQGIDLAEYGISKTSRGANRNRKWLVTDPAKASKWLLPRLEKKKSYRDFMAKVLSAPSSRSQILKARPGLYPMKRIVDELGKDGLGEIERHPLNYTNIRRDILKGKIGIEQGAIETEYGLFLDLMPFLLYFLDYEKSTIETNG